MARAVRGDGPPTSALAALGVVMAIAGSAGVPELVLAIASGVAVGAAVLVAFGAPNRRPSPAAVATALSERRPRRCRA